MYAWCTSICMHGVQVYVCMVYSEQAAASKEVSPLKTGKCKNVKNVLKPYNKD